MKKIVILVLALTLATSTAFAETKKKAAPKAKAAHSQTAPVAEESKPSSSVKYTLDSGKKDFVGGLLGLGLYSGFSPILFGAQYGHQYDADWNFGGALTYAKGSNVKHIGLFGHAYYNMKKIFKDIPTGFYGGGKIGLIFASVDSVTIAGVTYDTSAGSSTNLELGPVFGYEHPIANDMSIGGQCELLVGGGTMFNLLGSFRYYF